MAMSMSAVSGISSGTCSNASHSHHLALEIVIPCTVCPFRSLLVARAMRPRMHTWCDLDCAEKPSFLWHVLLVLR